MQYQIKYSQQRDEELQEIRSLYNQQLKQKKELSHQHNDL